MKYERERNQFPLLLNEWGLLEVGVEVGVCEGHHAKCILDFWPGLLHLVDAWAPLTDYEEKYDHEANYNGVFSRLSEHHDRFIVHRTTSLKAAEEFSDESLDFAYLDANHSYKAVLEDLNAWWPKVRKGGMLAGDDYGIVPEQYVDFGHGVVRFGVRRAVDEWAKKVRRNISIDILANWKNAIPAQCEVQARGWWCIK